MALTQVDFDGRQEIFRMIAINNSIKPKTLVKTMNLMGQDINEYDDEQTQEEMNRIETDEKKAAEVEASSNGPIIV